MSYNTNIKNYLDHIVRKEYHLKCVCTEENIDKCSTLLKTGYDRIPAGSCRIFPKHFPVLVIFYQEFKSYWKDLYMRCKCRKMNVINIK